MFSYTSAGLTTHKRLDVSRGVNTATLASDFTYDNEGKLVTYTYPLSGNVYQYSFDSMGRQLQLVNITTGDIYAHAATYNAASQLTGFSYGPAVGWAETRTYNTLGQLTRLTVPAAVDMEYTFSPTQNNGRITKQKDWVSGEEVNYTYDQLNRLLTASTTSTAWGLSFGYDGFGNKLSQTVTKGSAPTMNVTVDAATNRLVGSTYDANGNLAVGSGLTLSYDISNRIATAAGPSAEWYAYASDNKRVWKKRQTGASTYEENVYFYSVTGQRLGTYTLTDSSGTLSVAYKSLNFYFAGKLIKEGTSWVAMDRLGSVRARYDGALTIFDHFPYGEEKPSTTTQDRNKFATYLRDDTNLDYAVNRYYTSGMGRFMTPDPFQDSARFDAGASWNRYSYVEGDSINSIDPSGLATVGEWFDYGGALIFRPLLVPDRVADEKGNEKNAVTETELGQFAEQQYGATEVFENNLAVVQHDGSYADRRHITPTSAEPVSVPPLVQLACVAAQGVATYNANAGIITGLIGGSIPVFAPGANYVGAVFRWATVLHGAAYFVNTRYLQPRVCGGGGGGGGGGGHRYDGDRAPAVMVIDGLQQY